MCVILMAADRQILKRLSCLLLLSIALPVLSARGDLLFPGPSYADSGMLAGWGWNEYGQANVPEGEDYAAIAAGNDYSLALKANGSIVGWGINEYGQATAPEGYDFVDISAGVNHSMALRRDGSIVCWGNNDQGQATTPADGPFLAISAGTFHSLAITYFGTIVGWGSDEFGQATPPAGDDFVAISAGSNHNLALKSDGSVAAWGSNEYGQCNVPMGNDFQSIAAGYGHSHALRTDGSIVSWGYNEHRQTEPPAGNDYVAIAAGGYHCLALRADGSVRSWGLNNAGQTQVPEGQDILAISGGHFHSLVMRRRHQTLAEGDVPCHVSVLPVFFVPSDQKTPTYLQQMAFMEHMNVARARYMEMLKNRDTFDIAEVFPRIVFSRNPFEYYRWPDNPVAVRHECMSEIFEAFGFNRFNCPYVFAIIVMNPDENVPAGSGRPFQEGLNNGGGWCWLSSYGLDNFARFQSILQHELGHCFGLVHASDHGYDQMSNASIMSYNPNHYYSGFVPPDEPGILIPEDLRRLALNTRVFPDFYFDMQSDLPSGYAVKDWVNFVLTWEIPGQVPYRIVASTTSGEAYNSSVSNVVHGLIRTQGQYDANTMWHSEKTETGWVSLDLTFPVEVSLIGTMIHSQHSNQYHRAFAVRIEVPYGDGFTTVCSKDLASQDEYVAFAETTAKSWRFHFEAGSSQYVVIRGIRFFSSSCEIFCPDYPYNPDIF